MLNTSEMLSEFCQLPDVDGGDDCLPSQHCNQKTPSFTVPEDSDNDGCPLTEKFITFSSGVAYDSAIPWITILPPFQNDEPKIHLL
jgi:hypothetical protein